MQTREYRTLDKSEWPRGEWDSEPDKKQWQDPATGLPCLIVRNGLSGNLCGYVGVPPEHPFYGIGFHECFESSCKAEPNDCEHTPEMVLLVHGGITFANACHPDAPEEQGICHRVNPGESDDVWWFGFDCGHAFDFMPRFYAETMRHHEVFSVKALSSRLKYQNWEMVESEVSSLAKQLKALERGR